MRFTMTFLFLFFSFIQLEANNFQVIKNGPIHEAYVSQEFGAIILQAAGDEPPPSIKEQKPPSVDEKTIWIPGYWSWSRDLSAYIWVSGVVRRPPPGHQWIAGHWRNYPQGWVWMSGFWSKIPESDFEFIAQAPPDPLDEKVPTPPPPVNALFWAPGYWELESDVQEFQWLSGRWSMLGPEFVYVPAQYYWREDGYLFVPGFWDWPIESRGTAFAAVAIPPENQERGVFEPSVIVKPLMIMEILYPQWPSYPCLFRHHFYYHHDLWVAWGAVPPWWQWYSWWCFPKQDAWWLWWWWSHPGYPNPPWLDSAVTEKIKPPSDFVLKMMKTVKPPATVTRNGVVGSKELIDAIEKATGKQSPILSSDPKQVQHIQNLADPNKLMRTYLKPTGTGTADPFPPKPNAGSSNIDLKRAPGRVKLPPYPAQEIELSAQISQNNPAHTPSYVSSPSPPSQPYEPPVQGYKPYYQYPQTQMQTQHLDTRMTEPQPQKNPEGPKAHPLPLDESTLPNY